MNVLPRNMHHATHQAKGRRGFTLLEVLVSLGIVTFFLTFALVVQKDITTLNLVAQASISAQDDARRAFKKMTTDVRAATYADNGAYPISAAATTSITFYADSDGDGKAERIRYFVNGTKLERGVVIPIGTPASYGGTETVTDVARNLAMGATPIFDYYDANYDGTTAPLTLPAMLSSIRLVKITLIIDNNGGRPPGPQTYSTQVSLRNLKDNL